MPITYRIITGRNRVLVDLSGQYSAEDIAETINSVVNHPLYESGFSFLSDHRNVDRAISTEQLMMTTHHLQGLSESLSGTKWAAVVGQETSYGMMNMMSVYIETIPIYLRPFYTHEEAEDWLDGELFPGVKTYML